MQNPPGVGKPACASRARLAALGPTRAGSVAVAAESGRVNAVMRISRSLYRLALPLPCKGEGAGGVRGLAVHASVAITDPHRLASLATSPFQGEEKHHFTW